MNKKAIIDETVKNLANVDYKITKKDMGTVLEALEKTVFEGMSSATKDEPSEVKLFSGITLRGVYHGERTARSPKDGSTVVVPEKFVPKCKFGKAIKDFLA